jgi:hypothetical protein
VAGRAAPRAMRSPGAAAAAPHAARAPPQKTGTSSKRQRRLPAAAQRVREPPRTPPASAQAAEAARPKRRDPRAPDRGDGGDTAACFAAAGDRNRPKKRDRPRAREARRADLRYRTPLLAAWALSCALFAGAGGRGRAREWLSRRRTFASNCAVGKLATCAARAAGPRCFSVAVWGATCRRRLRAVPLAPCRWRRVVGDVEKWRGVVGGVAAAPCRRRRRKMARGRWRRGGALGFGGGRAAVTATMLRPATVRGKNAHRCGRRRARVRRERTRGPLRYVRTGHM